MKIEDIELLAERIVAKKTRKELEQYMYEDLVTAMDDNDDLYQMYKDTMDEQDI